MLSLANHFKLLDAGKVIGDQPPPRVTRHGDLANVDRSVRIDSDAMRCEECSRKREVIVAPLTDQ